MDRNANPKRYGANGCRRANAAAPLAPSDATKNGPTNVATGPAQHAVTATVATAPAAPRPAALLVAPAMPAEELDECAAVSFIVMKISELAKGGGVGVETVRYYQRIGLLPIPKRTTGTRAYGAGELRRLQFIRRAQTLGFTLEEIAGLLELSAADCKHVERVATARLDAVEERIAALQRVQGVLQDVVRRCRDRRPYDGCPIIETLALP